MKKIKARVSIPNPGFPYLSWGHAANRHDQPQLFQGNRLIFQGEIYCPLSTIPFEEPDPDWQVGDWFKYSFTEERVCCIMKIFSSELAYLVFDRQTGEFLHANNMRNTSTYMIKIDPPAWASKEEE